MPRKDKETEKTQIVAQGGDTDPAKIRGGSTTEDQIARNAGPQPAPEVK
jgi:hypothetical protein